MSNTYRLLVGLTLVLFSAGCITTVSHRSPFDSYVGKSLTTQTETFLYSDTAWEDNAQMLFSPPHKVLWLGESRIPASDYRRKAQVVLIPKAQPVKIIEIQREVGDGGVSYNAIGEIFVPHWKRFVRFRYPWGTNDKLRRAPWEADSVPRSRLIR